MSKKVLVLTSSLRKGSNSIALAEAFSAGAREAGHEVFSFNVSEMNIAGCRACNQCWSEGTACVQNDGFTKLEPYFESCDVIVFAVPLYWAAFPAQMKCVIDRLYSYGGAGGDRPLTISESVLMLTSGDAGEAQCEGIKLMYKSMTGYIGWKNRGILFQGGLNETGKIGETDAPKRAEELGVGI